MIFQGDTFAPEHFPDPRARRALLDASSTQVAKLRPRDLTAAIVRLNDPKIMNVFFEALELGGRLEDLIVTAEQSHAPDLPSIAEPRSRDGFTPSALDALDAWERRLYTDPRFMKGSLELLLSFLLRNFTAQDRAIWSAFDPELAAALFREKAAQTASTLETTGSPCDDRTTPETQATIAVCDLSPYYDLTEQAARASIENSPFDGEPIYESVLAAIQRGLRRRTARHMLLVADRGVGVSTILAEFARRIATGQLSLLAGKRVLLSDLRFVVPDESRQRMVEILSALSGRADTILCLDHLAALLRSRESTNKPLLLSLLSQVPFHVIGIVTPHEYEELIALDCDMSEFFSVVEVPEPSISTAIKLMERYASGLEQSFHLTIDCAAVQQAVVLSANYILNERLPGKALKILHRVCEDRDYERVSGNASSVRVTAEDVVRAVADVSGVPEGTLRGIAERSDFEQSLSEEIVGQPHVVKELAAELGLIKAGLTDPDKPASVMLFVGQTGTGKTETGKALAKFYSASKRLRTYTLGNFVEPHSVAGIIGVPPGYVGHDQGGRIVNDLNSDPYCVFLLDEADKAHPDVLQPFLNLFDEGWIRDQRGATGYANKSIFILTTNVGQRMIADMHKQGKTPDEIAARMKEALAQIRHGKSNRPVFAPEFLARIKRIIVFNPLDREAMAGICRKLYRQMQVSWRERRRKELVVSEELLQEIAAKAHEQNEKTEGREGGRIVRKLMADRIEIPVQQAISESPDVYRTAEKIVVEFLSPPVDEAGAEADEQTSTVRFETADHSRRREEEYDNVA